MVSQLFIENRISQIGSDKFLLPYKYRLTSKTGSVYTTDQNKSNEIRFYLANFFRCSSIFYVEEASILPEGYSRLQIGSEKFIRVEKLDEHWYWVLSK